MCKCDKCLTKQDVINAARLYMSDCCCDKDGGEDEICVFMLLMDVFGRLDELELKQKTTE